MKAKSAVLIAMAFGEGQVLMCTPSSALEFVKESGLVGDDGAVNGFFPERCGVDIDAPKGLVGVMVGVLRVIEGGPESWEMPDIRDYYAVIDALRPVTEEEWLAHLSDEWPEGRLDQ